MGSEVAGQSEIASWPDFRASREPNCQFEVVFWVAGIKNDHFKVPISVAGIKNDQFKVPSSVAGQSKIDMWPDFRTPPKPNCQFEVLFLVAGIKNHEFKFLVLVAGVKNEELKVPTSVDGESKTEMWPDFLVPGSPYRHFKVLSPLAGMGTTDSKVRAGQPAAWEDFEVRGKQD